MAEVQYALSIKQPWAALLLHGLKSVEVRAWQTARRGAILIHAARIADPRPEAWAHVTDEVRGDTELLGGIIGSVELIGCRTYRTAVEFAADQNLHLNAPDWFKPVMYGFTFAEPERLPFRRYPGWMRFFVVEEATP
jgi:hypothetical protein